MPGGDVRLLCLAAGGGTEDSTQGRGRVVGGGDWRRDGADAEVPHCGSRLCCYYLFISIIRFIVVFFFCVELYLLFSVVYRGILWCRWKKIMVFCH